MQPLHACTFLVLGLRTPFLNLQKEVKVYLWPFVSFFPKKFCFTFWMPVSQTAVLLLLSSSDLLTLTLLRRSLRKSGLSLFYITSQAGILVCPSPFCPSTCQIDTCPFFSLRKQWWKQLWVRRWYWKWGGRRWHWGRGRWGGQGRKWRWRIRRYVRNKYIFFNNWKKSGMKDFLPDSNCDM